MRKKTIPVLATTAMALATPGCGSSDSEKSLLEQWRTFCELRRECDMEGFDAEFESIEECAQTSNASMVFRIYDLPQEMEQGCVDAYAEYLDCVSHATCDPVPDFCSEETEAISGACTGP